MFFELVRFDLGTLYCTTLTVDLWFANSYLKFIKLSANYDCCDYLSDLRINIGSLLGFRRLMKMLKAGPIGWV